MKTESQNQAGERTQFTVIGERGNDDGPYTQPLHSLGAAIKAIETGDLPCAPISRDGGVRSDNAGRVTFTVRTALVYSVIEHAPYQHNKETHEVTGGYHTALRIYHVFPALGEVTERYSDEEWTGELAKNTGRCNKRVWPNRPGNVVTTDDLTQHTDRVPVEWLEFVARKLAGKQ